MSAIARMPKPLVEMWNWQQSGACKDLPSEIFFHPDGERGPSRRNRENRAKAICATCPVMAQCADQALAIQEPYGIWGGLTEDDRVAILENKVRVPHAS